MVWKKYPVSGTDSKQQVSLHRDSEIAAGLAGVSIVIFTASVILYTLIIQPLWDRPEKLIGFPPSLSGYSVEEVDIPTELDVIRVKWFLVKNMV